MPSNTGCSRGALFDVLANLAAINDKICEDLGTDGPPDYDDY
jgi:hypothetical protein